MGKKSWFDFHYKEVNGKLIRRFPGYKIRSWYYNHLYKRKELKRLFHEREFK